MATKFFTNNKDNSLVKKIEGIFDNSDKIHHFDILVGYFRASGYCKIQTFLAKVKKIRILVGINVDKLVQTYAEKGQICLFLEKDAKENFIEETIQDIQNAPYTQLVENGMKQFLNDVISKKIEIKAHPSKKLHAKIYIFRPELFNEHSFCEVITGSSNLTEEGLGSKPDSNYEFNVSLRDFDDVKFATDEFERLWNEAIPILNTDAKKIEKNTYLRDDFTPHQLYIKALIEYFGERVDANFYKMSEMLPKRYYNLEYQIDAANQAYQMLEKHNGFLLADVVGLGKTVIACMVIKKFIYENGSQTKVLLVVPPALKHHWYDTLKEFQIEMYFKIISIGSLHKIFDEKDMNFFRPAEYDMVVIDESHKFRNDKIKMYEHLQNICKTLRQNPSPKGDVHKKIILISATPLNNKPQDIENQLYLFQDRRNSTLENVRNLEAFFKPINEEFKKLPSENSLNVGKIFRFLNGEETFNYSKIADLFEKLRKNVIEPLVIRRTRKDILGFNDYLTDIKNQNLTFPEVCEPENLRYTLTPKECELFVETVNFLVGIDENGNEIESFGYYRYRLIEFLNPESQKQYGNVKVISELLAGIMRTLLVKRLESSFFAFKQSLNRLLTAIKNIIEMFKNDKIFIASNLDINKLIENGKTDEEIEKIVEKNDGKVFQCKDFNLNYLDLLEKDKEKIENLIKKWENVKRDPKLDEFIKQLNEKLFGKSINTGEKLIIFTESVETANFLAEKITKYRCLVATSKNRKEIESVIRENFDANIPFEKQKNDFDILISTEVLSEGINLHRSNVMVNYDIPWNATKLIQRSGRINRIGTKAAKIYIFNFYPTVQGEQQIRLIQRALLKIQAFHIAFGSDDKMLSVLEERGKAGLFIPNIKLQQEASETLKFLQVLRDFKRKNEKEYRKINKIPNKARCGRDKTFNQTKISYDLSQTSLTYLKSKNHPGIFCLVFPDNTCVELDFAAAATIFEAEENEKSIDLHQFTLEQAAAAHQFFVSDKTQSNISTITNQKLTKTQKKADEYLSAMLKFATDEQKIALNNCRKLIEIGRFNDLPKKINDFFNNNLLTPSTASNVIPKFFEEIVKKYCSAEGNEEKDEKKRIIISPEIVLTQTFS